ncbi:hypothetical protein EVAR_18161_1 [Eumeta japonica]|uniref:Uncharacterized protein n=1 Tax=Eumeta variegata TaxID=151549 RepID=A0A4C1UWJ4_EUMVA|nr:hypothetical protein EVAR_18161_1 [Eumeta japonica]
MSWYLKTSLPEITGGGSNLVFVELPGALRRANRRSRRRVRSATSRGPPRERVSAARTLTCQRSRNERIGPFEGAEFAGRSPPGPVSGQGPAGAVTRAVDATGCCS